MIHSVRVVRTSELLGQDIDHIGIERIAEDLDRVNEPMFGVDVDVHDAPVEACFE